MAKGTQETDRALAMAMWAHSSVGRSDDVRLFYLADLITPQYIPAVGESRLAPKYKTTAAQSLSWVAAAESSVLLLCAGPSNCYVLPLVLRGGKKQRGGRPGYSGEQLCVAALSLMLLLSS